MYILLLRARLTSDINPGRVARGLPPLIVSSAGVVWRPGRGWRVEESPPDMVNLVRKRLSADRAARCCLGAALHATSGRILP